MKILNYKFFIAISILIIILILFVIIKDNNNDKNDDDKEYYNNNEACINNCNSQFGNCQQNYDTHVNACSTPCDNIMCVTQCQNDYIKEYTQCLSQQGKCCGECGGYTNNDPNSTSYYLCASTPFPYNPPTLKPAGESCSSDNDCQNASCGRSTAADGAPLICCPSGSTDTYGGYDYCKGMPSGSTCWSDSMCSSNNCNKNCPWYDFGVCKGTCS